MQKMTSLTMPPKPRLDSLTTESLKIYERMVSESPILMSMVDREYVYRRINNAYLHTWERSHDQIVGHHVATILGQDQFEAIVKPCLDRALAGETVKYGAWFVTPSRGRRFLSMVYSPYYDSHQQVGGVAVSGQDITELIETESALRENEARLRLATQTGLIGVWDWDIVPNKLTWDSSMYALYGIREEDFGGAYDAWTRTLHPDDREHVEREIQAALRGEQQYGPEFRIIRPDGMVRYLKATSRTTYSQAGQALRMIGTNIDITARKHSEEALREARDEADRANRAKSVFLASMSHELRTPLNAILGFAQLLQMDIAELPSSARTSVETIVSSAHHLLRMISDILDLARIEAGKIEISSKTFDLRAMLSDLISMHRTLAAAKGLQLRLGHTSALPQFVEGDETHLRQILVNLLGNAIKFTDKGQVELQVTAFPAAAPLRSEQLRRVSLRFSVVDTGVGMDADAQRRLFQEFSRVGASSNQTEGSGLGLVISSRLARLLGTELHVQSEPGHGSTFWLDLDWPTSSISEKHTVENSLPAEAERARPPVVLIADDNPVNRHVLCAFLKKMEIPFIVASDGQEALEQALCHHPAVVLMDLVMPGMDGLVATRKIRAIPELKDTVIIGLSANVFRDAVEEAMQAGCDDYLPKPVDLGLLRKKLKVILDHSAKSR